MRKPSAQDWQNTYEHRCEWMRNALQNNAPRAIVEAEARMLFEAIHRGPWRACYVLFKRGLLTFWDRYLLLKWEWIKTKVFRRSPDELLAMIKEIEAEERTRMRMKGL